MHSFDNIEEIDLEETKNKYGLNCYTSTNSLMTIGGLKTENKTNFYTGRISVLIMLDIFGAFIIPNAGI
jgi:hypothetical protein